MGAAPQIWRARLLATLLAVFLPVPVGFAGTTSQAAELPNAVARVSANGNVEDHQDRQKRPVELGTSGSTGEDLVPGVICCGGTLGALVTKKNRYFILSNNHVLGRFNQAEIGEDVLQPGLFDTKCNVRNRNYIGTLAGFTRLKLNKVNKVDLAIAETSPELVAENGAIRGIGVPGNQIVKPVPGASVVKSGRSTGVTRGRVDLVNLRGGVTFAEKCGSDEEVKVEFKGVFTVVDGSFSSGGDSGAVIYEDVADCPRAMGHLFAGTEDFTAGLTMKRTLKAAKKLQPKGKARLVGCTPTDRLTARRGSTRLARAVRSAEAVQRWHEESLLASPGVIAMGIGRDPADADAVVFRILVEGSRADLAVSLPSDIEGVPVQVVASDPIRARSCPANRR